MNYRFKDIRCHDIIRFLTKGEAQNDGCEANGNELKKEDWLKLYEITEINRRDYSDRQWETVKLTTTLITLLITATSVLVSYFYKSNSNDMVYLLLALAITPFIAFVVSAVGYCNFKRETRHCYEQVGILISIRAKLGLKKTGNNAFKQEESIFPERSFEYQEWKKDGRSICKIPPSDP